MFTLYSADFINAPSNCSYSVVIGIDIIRF